MPGMGASIYLKVASWHHYSKITMNVHFFVTFAKDAYNSPFAQALREQGIDFRIFSEQISLRYAIRAWLYIVGWPRMIAFAFRQSSRSLSATPKADWVVVQSHFDILAMSILSVLLFRKKPKLMLLGFIYTRRKSVWVSKLKQYYFSLIIWLADCVVCHSRLEVEDNRVFFKTSASKFVYIPYGLHVAVPDIEETDTAPAPYALSAGRSGRDYDLLIKVFTALGYPLHIVCDSVSAVSDQGLPDNIKVLRSHYGGEYIKEIALAKLVIIPIAVDDISAGQMVLLQAMALHKPVIITDTPSTRLYCEHRKTALMIEKNSLVEMRAAVEVLWVDERLAENLAENGFVHFNSQHSMAVFVKNICDVLKGF